MLPASAAAEAVPDGGRPFTFSMVALLGSWGLAIVCLSSVLPLHESTPGPTVAVPAAAMGGGTSLGGHRARLTLFLHPKCPCSSASVDQLERLLAVCRGRLDAEVIFFQPDNQTQGWAQTRLWERTRKIPGVAVRFDKASELAKGAGARTSGHALLYDRFGRLRFSGGVTASRGYPGDSDGFDAIVAAVLEGSSGASGVRTAPVFGCELYPGPEGRAAR